MTYPTPLPAFAPIESLAGIRVVASRIADLLPAPGSN